MSRWCASLSILPLSSLFTTKTILLYSNTSLFWSAVGQFGMGPSAMTREVPSIQRQFCAHLHVAGTVGTVLIRRPLLYKGLHCVATLLPIFIKEHSEI